MKSALFYTGEGFHGAVLFYFPLGKGSRAAFISDVPSFSVVVTSYMNISLISSCTNLIKTKTLLFGWHKIFDTNF